MIQMSAELMSMFYFKTICFKDALILESSQVKNVFVFLIPTVEFLGEEWCVCRILTDAVCFHTSISESANVLCAPWKSDFMRRSPRECFVTSQIVWNPLLASCSGNTMMVMWKHEASSAQTLTHVRFFCMSYYSCGGAH